jgi:hypothetical protein
MTVAIIMCITCIVALGVIISLSPLDDLNYHGWRSNHASFTSPYTSSIYLGWAIATAFALILSGVLPAVSWFATYRLSLSSAACIAVFTGNTWTTSQDDLLLDKLLSLLSFCRWFMT